jgi:ribosomal protein S18 acetylase RimI-like enzyme
LTGDELFIAMKDDVIAGAMVLNHEFNQSYSDCQWSVKAAQSEAVGIHALAVHPSCRKKGYAKQLVQFAADYAIAHHQKVIRLDVLKGNRSAENLYRSMGFRYRHTLPMFYEDTGWTDFDLYEYPLIQE